MNDEPTTKPDDDAPETVPAPKVKRPRGFAVMDRAKVRAIASAGGKAAHANGTAHRFTTEEAQAAGRKGGMAPHASHSGGRPRDPETT